MVQNLQEHDIILYIIQPYLIIHYTLYNHTSPDIERQTHQYYPKRLHFQNGNRRYKYLVLGHEETYFVKEHSDSKSKYSEDDIIKMLEFLVDNIFVVFAGKVFQQTVGIPMGTNCAPLLADIFLYSYEADFIQSLLSTGKKHLASRFNLTYRYIDDVLSINNPEFENYLGQMYPAELEIKDTTESTTSASYLDLLLSIGRDGQLHTHFHLRQAR